MEGFWPATEYYRCNRPDRARFALPNHCNEPNFRENSNWKRLLAALNAAETAIIVLPLVYAG